MDLITCFGTEIVRGRPLAAGLLFCATKRKSLSAKLSASEPTAAPAAAFFRDLVVFHPKPFAFERLHRNPDAAVFRVVCELKWIEYLRQQFQSAKKRS